MFKTHKEEGLCPSQKDVRIPVPGCMVVVHMNGPTEDNWKATINLDMD